ncbi:hypothetical protein [Streptomyces sp. NEAU-174]|uniref:hypothetical protein n=1 Tax=Streptomyces sp. NEAU-174 TaxID=3458254 RepID=UPI004044D4F6
MSDEPRGLWPVAPSEAVGETLADPGLSAGLFSAVVALTVSIAEDPWLKGSAPLEGDDGWREVLIPSGRCIAEYRITQDAHEVIINRIVSFLPITGGPLWARSGRSSFAFARIQAGGEAMRSPSG